MSKYVYLCKKGHEQIIHFSMSLIGTKEEPVIRCKMCMRKMWRKPVLPLQISTLSPRQAIHNWSLGRREEHRKKKLARKQAKLSAKRRAAQRRAAKRRRYVETNK